jgi:hypothetical protein
MRARVERSSVGVIHEATRLSGQKQTVARTQRNRISEPWTFAPLAGVTVAGRDILVGTRADCVQNSLFIEIKIMQIEACIKGTLLIRVLTFLNPASLGLAAVIKGLTLWFAEPCWTGRELMWIYRLIKTKWGVFGFATFQIFNFRVFLREERAQLVPSQKLLPKNVHSLLWILSGFFLECRRIKNEKTRSFF